MGFFDKLKDTVVSAVSAPVSVPLKVTSNVIRETGEAFGITPISKPLSQLAAAPYAVLQKGESVTDLLPNVISSARQLAPIAGSIVSGGVSGDLPGIGMNLLSQVGAGSPPSELNAPQTELPSNSPTMVSVPVSSPSSSYTLPILIGAAGLTAIIILRRR